jgi:hypothetical protein
METDEQPAAVSSTTATTAQKEVLHRATRGRANLSSSVVSAFVGIDDHAPSLAQTRSSQARGVSRQRYQTKMRQTARETALRTVPSSGLIDDEALVMPRQNQEP